MTIDTLAQQRLSLDQTRQVVAAELEATNRLIQEQLFSEVPLIQSIVQHIIQSGGKRIRPLIVLLMAKALNYQGTEHIELATVIEFIHTATLLHDDVVDESLLRRGYKTANALWDNQASVLAGDFLYSRAFQLLAKRSNIPVTKLLAETTNAIAEGEIWQLMNRDNVNLSEAHYFKVIQYKTAKLFSASATIGALIANNDPKIHQAACDYGTHLGIAFQIVDDLLDYTSEAEEMGKNTGDDLADGKLTLPLIYALQHSDDHTVNLIKQAIHQRDLSQLDLIKKIIVETNAISYTQHHASHQITSAQKALELLPNSDARTALHNLAQFVVTRSF